MFSWLFPKSFKLCSWEKHFLALSILSMQQLVGNKAKGRISKLVLQENKVCKLFRKTNISFTLTGTRTYQGVRIIQLGK